MKRSGVTLIEVLIAVSLLSLLSLGILFALRVGMGALEKTDRRLMNNRRVAGAQRILQQQLAGFIPVIAVAAPSPDAAAGMKVPFFEGREQSMRFVSTYSLSEASRGIPQILEFQVIPGEQGRGVRLVVNENPYSGPRSAGVFCLGPGPDPELGVPTQRFLPISIGPASFVLADRLAYCRFSFLGINPAKNLEQWLPNWTFVKWPSGIRVEMASLDTDLVNLKPVTVTAAVHVNRDPALEYLDAPPE
ncbi:MAG: prepilin-type N-terminal cleavage/methylation domain-containing protein [Acidobacteriia bacterium]|nr:prepilin-type N-terminal cleavage/methylation domain-containing protein [Terriglobia bacterium]